VINTINQRKDYVWPKDALKYVANGEIGVVVGHFRRGNEGLPWKLEVEFSSQPTYAYEYTNRGFGDEGDPPLELAYAITVHRAQGSEFGKTILILPKDCRPLSRELI
jgi:ATP-dependent exoDNAse (exonuclease V) alpha subunit